MARIIGNPLPNIPWQEKPAGWRYPVWRYTENPIITRDNLFFANSIFNSAVVPYGDGFKGVFKPQGGATVAAWYEADARREKEDAIRAEEAKKLPGYVEKTNKDVPFPYHIARVEEPEVENRPEATKDDYVIGIRPEFIKIDPEGAIEGEVFSAMPTGMETTLKIRVGAYLLTAVVFGGTVYKIGQKVRLSFSGDNIMLFARTNGRRIVNGSFNV